MSEAVKYFNIAKKLNDSKPVIKKLTSKAKELKRALSVSADGQYLLNIPKLKTFVDTNKQLILDYVSTLNEEYEKLTQYKSQLNEFVRQLEIEALERCNLPTNYNQLQTAKSKDLYYNIYAVTNEMFQLVDNLWRTRGIVDITETPVALDEIDDAKDMIGTNTGLKSKRVHPTTLLGLMRSKENMKTGSSNIAPAAVSNIVKGFMAKDQLELRGFRCSIDGD